MIEIPLEVEPYESIVAEALMRVQRNVKSVLSKGTERMGEYRIRDMKLLAGDPDTEVVHRESGCIFKVDPVKAYFSPRESTEREKISAAVGLNERVLVMFSGIGPFPICIAKRRPTTTCVAVELNPEAHMYCLENIRLNKVGNRVTALLGDVREICPNLGESYDRVLMPLPKGAYKFLDIAIPLVKPGGVLHFYHWSPRDDPFTDGENVILEAVEKSGRSFEVINRVKVSEYSPSALKVRFDALIW